MKKILVTLLVVSSMVFALAAAALASSVYVDGVISGKEKTEYIDDGVKTTDKLDMKGYALGANLNCGKLFFNLEYAKDTYEFNTPGFEDIKADTINFKAGYTLFGDDQGYLALTAGYHQLKSDVTSNPKNTGVIIGLSGASQVSEKLLLEGSAGYSVSGTSKSDGSADVDVDILLAQVKCSYFFTENLGLGIGYKLNQYKYDDTEDTKTTISGPTVGLTYKF